MKSCLFLLPYITVIMRADERVGGILRNGTLHLYPDGVILSRVLFTCQPACLCQLAFFMAFLLSFGVRIHVLCQ